jgi:flagellar motility protein MotE (MotC chaperone)
MPTLTRLLATLVVAAGLALTMRLGALWHDAGTALAQTAPPAVPPKEMAKPSEPATTPPMSTSSPSGSDPLKPSTGAQRFSPAEVELLQGLSKRRTELDERAEQLDRRELLLKAAEQRVQEKIDKLQQMQVQVDKALGKVDEQEDERLKSLVHIYENMKPQEAARILEQLDMTVLLHVLTRMKDQKTGPILASMPPDKARAVTLALAERKQLPDLRTN